MTQKQVGLNKNGPYRSIRSGSIRRCHLVSVGVTLLEEVCLIHFLLPDDPDVEFSPPSLTTCLPAHYCVFHHDDNELYL